MNQSLRMKVFKSVQEDVFWKEIPSELKPCIIDMIQVCSDRTATTLKANKNYPFLVQFAHQIFSEECRRFFIDYTFTLVELFLVFSLEESNVWDRADLLLKKSSVASNNILQTSFPRAIYSKDSWDVKLQILYDAMHQML